MNLSKTIKKMTFRTRLLIFCALLTIVVYYFMPEDNNKPVQETDEPMVQEIYRHYLLSRPPDLREVPKIDYAALGMPQGKVFDIFMWTTDQTVPFVYLKNGKRVFVDDGCQYTNCFVTRNMTHVSDISLFDAIIFNAPDLPRWGGFADRKPPRRNPEQIYVFASIESAHNYPVCSKEFDDFFNWTWTYRTTSEVKWGYVDVTNLDGNLIGPHESIEWISDEESIVEGDEMDIVYGKTKAVAWLVSNCLTKSNREEYVKDLKASLQMYNLSVDVFGRCGDMNCGDTPTCHELFKKDYFFYLSFENSFAEDYVTEKFNHAMKNLVVPIVWGGADYSRFAPPNSYINAREIEPDKLANLIDHLIKNPETYSAYFKWRRHYKYLRGNDTPETKGTCRFCKALNIAYSKEKIRNQNYIDFRSWWNAGIPKKSC